MISSRDGETIYSANGRLLSPSWPWIWTGWVFGLGLCGTGLAYLALYIVADFGALGASAVTYIPGIVALVIGRFLLGDEIHPLGYFAMVLTLGRDRTWGGVRGPRGNAHADVNRHDGPLGAAPGSPQPEADMGLGDGPATRLEAEQAGGAPVAPRREKRGVEKLPARGEQRWVG